MSLFLAPIHFMMYDKIKFREELINNLLNRLGNPSMKEQVDQLGVPEKGNLRDIIDLNNIHGWLQERINLSERRMALAVHTLYELGLEDRILNTLEHLGESQHFKGNALEAFQWMNEHFADGMPCDRAILPLEAKEDFVHFKVMVDVHRPHWGVYGLEEYYWEMRKHYVIGLLKNSKYELKEGNDGDYLISEKQ